MFAPAFSHVLVGWDASPAAARGLTLACRMTPFPGGTVTALSVVPPFAHIEADSDRARAIDDAQAPLREAFEQLLAPLALAPEQRVTLRFAEADRVPEILDRYTAEQLVDLLVVGLHGREGILHPGMGHVAKHVIKTSSCPVLVIPDEKTVGDTIYLRDSGHFATTLKNLFRPGRHDVTV
jgi:nucleotide-binding universal stress UspA family protein